MSTNGIFATQGMRRASGKTTADKYEYILQSLADIFTTPIGSRICRRDYGSRLFAMIDQPLNAVNRLRLAAELVMAATKHEPRVRITAAMVEVDFSGRVLFNFTARVLTNEELSRQIVLK